MMTIESLLERIATSCERQERLIEQLLGQSDKQIELLENAEGATTKEVPHVVIPNPEPVPTVPPIPAPAPAPTVPPVPTPAPAPASETSPFADQKQFMEYCMKKYKELGPIKGGMIQQILIELGASSIMNLLPTKYSEFYKRVEML